eukprot:8189411-Heterocapsa_arctica.AAC.1
MQGEPSTTARGARRRRSGGEAPGGWREKVPPRRREGACMHGVSDQQAEGDAWSKTLAAAWNRLMRALHGNGLPAGQVVMQAINCNGIRVTGRWAQVCSLEADILALTETHATDAAQKTLVHEAA